MKKIETNLLSLVAILRIVSLETGADATREEATRIWRELISDLEKEDLENPKDIRIEIIREI